MNTTNDQTITVVEPADKTSFETAVAALLERARENGVDVEGAWAPQTEPGEAPQTERDDVERWNLVISRVESDDDGVRSAPTTGGKPQRLGQCTACGEVYPLQIEVEMDLRPIGVDSECSCGNSEFVPVSE